MGRLEMLKALYLKVKTGIVYTLEGQSYQRRQLASVHTEESLFVCQEQSTMQNPL